MQAGGGWNAVFWCNHDQPRPVSRFGDEGRYREVSAKMLATAIHMLRGTPYIYQGEELGMTNAHFTRLDQVPGRGKHQPLPHPERAGRAGGEIFRILGARSRDNGRTPMQWTAGPNGGFTTGTPWLAVNENTAAINAAACLADPDSVLHYYKKLVALRKQYPVIQVGEYAPLKTGSPDGLRLHPHAGGRDAGGGLQLLRPARRRHAARPARSPERLIAAGTSSPTPPR